MQTIKLVPRGKTLFISLAGAAPIPFLDWANEIAAEHGVEFELAATSGNAGNYLITLSSDSWKGTENFCRVAACVDLVKALEAGGYARVAEDGENILNLSTSGPSREGQRGRSAFLGVFLNLSALTKSQGAGSGAGTSRQVTENAGETRYADALGNYIAAGGDVGDFMSKFGACGQVEKTGILEGLTKRLGTTVEVVDGEETPDQAGF